MKGKLIWRSLKTNKISVAKLKFVDVEKEERKKAEEGFVRSKDKVLIRHCIEAYRLKGVRLAKPRNAGRRNKPRSWRSIEMSDIKDSGVGNLNNGESSQLSKAINEYVANVPDIRK